MKIALITGGPSLERGISLNSARSVLDHLTDSGIEIVPIYIDLKRRAYLLSPGQLYSNTPSDFDFKVRLLSKPLSDAALVKTLRNCDLVFPTIHGQFGEDGQLQRFLEKHNIPFVGAPSEACKICFDKYNAARFIESHGFHSVPSIVLKIYGEDHEELITQFFKEHQLERAIVKPAAGGSSIGVFSVGSAEEALDRAQHLFKKRMDTRVVVEKFVRGTEFTVIILQNRFKLPVALIPSEIEQDYKDHQFFDFRRKYLPTRQVAFHCPPRFSDEMIEQIRIQSEQLFQLFGMRDFARFDGWVLPDGKLWFSDFNPISGMEQNSFVFQQGARVGLTHRGVLRYVLKSAAERYGISVPHQKTGDRTKRTHVSVVFGGGTSERQVSLMSGTNVWLKLKHSNEVEPNPYLMDESGDIWKVPYSLLLSHTTEEILDSCSRAESDESRLSKFRDNSHLRLALTDDIEVEPYFTPRKMSFEKFMKNKEYVFLALHGGPGENGELQEKLERAGIPFNGSGSHASRVCMDKYRTAELLAGLESEGIVCAPKHCVILQELGNPTMKTCEQLWKTLCAELHSKKLIVKPLADGCSSGIATMNSADQLKSYFDHLLSGATTLRGWLLGQDEGEIELPSELPEAVLFEPFIVTDKIRTVGSELRVKELSGWIEVTVGVLAQDGKLKALNPSLTVASGDVLSLEEKFQGGTGVNITPPPEELLSADNVQLVRQRIERVAEKLGIDNYARIDAFVERKTGKIMVIEANSLPGLTASTVFFHQGITEGIFPRELLETIVRESVHAAPKLGLVGNA